VEQYFAVCSVCFCKVDAVVDELPEVSDSGQQKPSDSDGEETREQCRARMVCICSMFIVICAVFYA